MTLLLFISTFIFLFAAYEIIHVFNIYEFSYRVTYSDSLTDNSSRVVIHHYPINSFGFRVPLRRIETKFRIIEGSHLDKFGDAYGDKLIMTVPRNLNRLAILAKPSGFYSSTLIEIDLK